MKKEYQKYWLSNKPDEVAFFVVSLYDQIKKMF